jgi:chemotaxis signal transduction protein
MQGFAVARPQLLTGLHEGQDLALLIDSDALQTDGAVADIAQMQEDAGGQIAPGTRDGANPADKVGARRPFLIVSIAGARFAIPLAQIDEILPAQAHNRIALPAQDNGFTGMIAHGGCAVPLYDLAHHLRLPRGADNACGFILLASAQGRRLGFALDGLAAVERTRLQTLTDPSRPAAQAGLPTHTICISDGSTCSVLDLSAVIARLADDATAAADVGAKIGF